MYDRNETNGQLPAQDLAPGATNLPLVQENSNPSTEETLRDYGDTRSSSNRWNDEKLEDSQAQRRSRARVWKQKALKFSAARRIAMIVDSDFVEASETEIRPPRTWRTTIIRFGPLSGVVAMAIAIASLFARLGILAGSDGKPATNWTVTPSTYLAVFTAIANLSVRYAAIQGVVIAWWNRALKGSTLAKLHWDWRAGTNLRGALTAGRHMGLLGLACLFSTIVVADGPFLQRSSTVISSPIQNQPVPLNVSMLPNLRTKRFGGWQGGNTWGYSEAFNATVPTNNGEASNTVEVFSWPNNLRASKSWYANEDLVGVVQGCSGTCRFKLRALALFPTSCTTHIQRINYTMSYDWKAFVDGGGAPPFDSLGMLIAVNLVVNGEREKINLITGYSTAGGDCKDAFLNYTICTLEAVIGDYDALVEHSKVKMNYLGTPELVELIDNAVNHTHDHHIDAHLSTLAPVVYLVEKWYEGLVAFFGYGEEKTGLLWAGSQVASPVFQDPQSAEYECPTYIDPRNDVLASMSKLMVFMSAYTNGLHWKDKFDGRDDLAVKSQVMGSLDGPQNVYSTEYKFFVVAAVIEAICIALVAPTYWGWWNIGRSVSFSPLETAKAFESPIFAAYNSNSSGRDLAKAVGNVRIQYGAKSTTNTFDSPNLAFSNPGTVIVPQDGSRFGE